MAEASLFQVQSIPGIEVQYDHPVFARPRCYRAPHRGAPGIQTGALSARAGAPPDSLSRLCDLRIAARVVLAVHALQEILPGAAAPGHAPRVVGPRRDREEFADVVELWQRP